MLNYNSFAVRIQEDDIPGLISTLRVCFYSVSVFFYLLDIPPAECLPFPCHQGINDTQVEFMLGNVRQMWQRFFYRDSILLEAQRQKRLFSEEAPWSVEVSKLPDDDDAFATFIQVDLLLNLLCGLDVIILTT